MCLFFFFFVLLQWSLAGIFEISNHWKFVGLFVFCTKFGCRYAFLYLLCARNANTKHFEHTRKIFKKIWVQFFLVFFLLFYSDSIVLLPMFTPRTVTYDCGSRSRFSLFQFPNSRIRTQFLHSFFGIHYHGWERVRECVRARTKSLYIVYMCSCHRT